MSSGRLINVLLFVFKIYLILGYFKYVYWILDNILRDRFWYVFRKLYWMILLCLLILFCIFWRVVMFLVIFNKNMSLVLFLIFCNGYFFLWDMFFYVDWIVFCFFMWEGEEGIIIIKIGGDIGLYVFVGWFMNWYINLFILVFLGWKYKVYFILVDVLFDKMYVLLMYVFNGIKFIGCYVFLEFWKWKYFV